MIELVNKVGVELINVSASDEMVAMAAWVSNDADSKERLDDVDKVRGLINFLYRNRHMSPFEHGIFVFKVDVPLFVAREFMRHRTASYNEVSGRYTQMKPRFYCGDEARVQEGKMGNYSFVPASAEQTAIYKQSKRQALGLLWKVYEQRLEAGIAKEQAREELPLSLMTQFYVTMNPRNLMQFLALRDDHHALKEIRDVAVQMRDIFKEHMPLTYGAFTNDQIVEAEPTKAIPTGATDSININMGTKGKDHPDSVISIINALRGLIDEERLAEIIGEQIKKQMTQINKRSK